MISDKNLGIKEAELVFILCMWVFVIHAVLLLKAFLKGISEVLVQGAKAEKIFLFS